MLEKPIEKNQQYEIEITDIGKGGEGIGKIKGFTVFVEGALPGDIAQILILKVKKSYGYGKLLQLTTPSPKRVKPLCDHARICGGCQLQHFDYEAQLQFKQKGVQDDLERIGQIKDVTVLPLIGMEYPYQYRNKAQFPVGGDAGKPAIGFYAKRSHRIIDTGICWLQNPKSNKAVAIVREFLEEYEIPPYREETHSGLVRHILTRVGFETGEVMVCIVVNGKALPHSEKLVEKLRDLPGMTSIIVNENKKKSNVILGDKIHVLWGADAITERIGDTQFKLSPLSFFQVNPVQTKVIYEKAMEFANLTGEETVLDLYCGIGTISLFLAKQAKKVIGVEIIPEAIADAKENAALNGIENVSFIVGAAEEVIPALYEEEGIAADVVVIDPPRKGCDGALLHTILSIAPKKIVYVSCDSGTLSRDLKILTEGGYQVKTVQPVDQFPMTNHTECVCLLEKK